MPSESEFFVGPPPANLPPKKPEPVFVDPAPPDDASLGQTVNRMLGKLVTPEQVAQIRAELDMARHNAQVTAQREQRLLVRQARRNAR